ncbi:MAG: Uma2 family endonuclease [Acidobacteriota bacterium]
MATAIRFTSADLLAMPDNGKRYEVIEGELYMSRQPFNEHQRVCGKLFNKLANWSEVSNSGEPFFAPGLIFAEDDDVAPDLIWISKKRLVDYKPDDHFHVAPELVIEVLSFGKEQERRDRETKLKLYSRRGVQEYWIANWRSRQIEVYRRKRNHLQLITTLNDNETLTSPLLPNFSCQVSTIFDHS